MKVTDSLRDAIAAQITYALCPESGVSPRDAFSKIMLLLETEPSAADALPSTWLQREPVRKVRLGNC